MIGPSEVALIKGMLDRGDKQMDIAVYFSINQARVNEIKYGKGPARKWRDIKPAESVDLPPKGPYVILAQDRAVANEAMAQAYSELAKVLIPLLEKHGIVPKPKITL